MKQASAIWPAIPATRADCSRHCAVVPCTVSGQRLRLQVVPQVRQRGCPTAQAAISGLQLSEAILGVDEVAGQLGKVLPGRINARARSVREQLVLGLAPRGPLATSILRSKLAENVADSTRCQRPAGTPVGLQLRVNVRQFLRAARG